MTAAELAAQLGAKKVGGGWLARCPAHDDAKASLSISEGGDGRILLFCHAGCTTKDIAQSMGMELKDLFQTSQREEIHYIYTDNANNPVLRVTRGFGKVFPQSHWDNGWVSGKAEKQYPYRLPYVIKGIKAGRTIYACEGEKDAETLSSLGEVATTNPGGAGKWRDELSRWFTDANVVIVRDMDEPGREHALKVAQSLRTIAKSVRIVEPKEGKDATDHVSAGYGVNDFVPYISQGVTQLSTIQTRQIDWIWKPYIPRGAITMLDGDMGIGKSWLALAICALLSTDGSRRREWRMEGEVSLILAAEDDADAVLRPRLESMEADISKVFVGCDIPPFPDGGMGWLTSWAESIRPDLIVIDPLTTYFGAGANTNAINEVQAYMKELARLCRDYNCGMVTVRHIGKSQKKDDGTKDNLAHKGIGSVGLGASCKSGLLVSREGYECNAIHYKFNYSESGAGPDIGYSLYPDQGFMWSR